MHNRFAFVCYILPPMRHGCTMPFTRQCSLCKDDVQLRR